MDQKQQTRELHAISQQHGMGSMAKVFFEKTPFTLNDMAKEPKIQLPELGTECQKVETPESIMRKGFECFFGARECFEKAVIEYDKRGGVENVNSVSIKAAIHLLAQAYDEVSAIWENDINV